MAYLESGVGCSGRGHKVRRVRISEKLGNDGRFGNDLPVVGQAGNEAAGVDGQVLGSAGDREVNDFLLEGDTKLCKRNVSTMGPYGFFSWFSC